MCLGALNLDAPFQKIQLSICKFSGSTVFVQTFGVPLIWLEIRAHQALYVIRKCRVKTKTAGSSIFVKFQLDQTRSVLLKP